MKMNIDYGLTSILVIMEDDDGLSFQLTVIEMYCSLMIDK